MKLILALLGLGLSIIVSAQSSNASFKGDYANISGYHSVLFTSDQNPYISQWTSFEQAVLVGSQGTVGYNAISIGYLVFAEDFGVAIGAESNSGEFSIAIGYGAGNNTNGNNNIFLGYRAGANSGYTSGNIIIGNMEDVTGNDRLMIDNTTRPDPLIDGNFSGRTLTLNADVLIPSNYSLIAEGLGANLAGSGLTWNGGQLDLNGYQLAGNGLLWNHSTSSIDLDVPVGTGLTWLGNGLSFDGSAVAGTGLIYSGDQLVLDFNTGNGLQYTNGILEINDNIAGDGLDYFNNQLRLDLTAEQGLYFSGHRTIGIDLDQIAGHGLMDSGLQLNVDGNVLAGENIDWDGTTFNVTLPISEPQPWSVNGDNIYYNGNLRLHSNPYIDDDGSMGGSSDDWMRLNGYVELSTGDSNYGLVLREYGNTNFMSITQKGGWSYFADQSNYNSYFLRGNGADVEVRGNLTVGDEIMASSGNSIQWNEAFGWGDHSLAGYYKSGSNSNFGSVDANYFDVKSGNGRGLRFWNSDSYKIHMGNTSEYKYGPVQDYSIKMNMSSNAGRGWTWGVSGATPVAALNNQGDMKIKGDFISEGTISASNINTSGVITATEGNSTNWNEAYTQRGSAIAGAGLLWSNGQLTVDGTQNLDNLGNHQATMNLDMNSKAITGLDLNGGGIQGNNYNITGVNELSINDAGEGINFHGKAKLFIVDDANDDNLRIESSKVSVSGKLAINCNEYPIIGGIEYDLVVGGEILTEEVNVLLQTDWPDYVFANDYFLVPLNEVEEYIKENHHLPEVPSAEEVEQEGISLGAMDAALLKKIEELTLHVIDQNKKIEMLFERVKELESSKSYH